MDQWYFNHTPGIAQLKILDMLAQKVDYVEIENIYYVILD